MSEQGHRTPRADGVTTRELVVVREVLHRIREIVGRLAESDGTMDANALYQALNRECSDIWDERSQLLRDE